MTSEFARAIIAANPAVAQYLIDTAGGKWI